MRLVADFSGHSTQEEAAPGPISPDVKDKLRLPKPHQMIQKKLKKDKDKEKIEPSTSLSLVPDEEKEDEDGLFPVLKLYTITGGALHVLRGLRSDDEKDRYSQTKLALIPRHLAILNLQKLIEAASKTISFHSQYLRRPREV